MSSEHDKERQKAVLTLAKHGWAVARVTKRGYLIMRCGCGAHKGSLPKTPSNPNKLRYQTEWLISQCSVR
jgi:hypothetical protein